MTPRFDFKVVNILTETKSGERICKLTGEKWMMTDEEIGWYKRLNVPPSKYSPLTRLRLLTAFFIGFQWWNNKSAKDGSVLISPTHPASGVKVLPDADWFASDFSNVFIDPATAPSVLAAIEQLRGQIPTTAYRNFIQPVNSIAAISSGDEDSYFVNACRSKRTLFAMNALDSEDCAEIYQCLNTNRSYHLVHCERIFNGRYLQECRDCINSQFLFDCRNCEDCFMATNKRNKRFIFRNEQLTEVEYRERMMTIDLSCRSSLETLVAEYDAMVQSAGIWPENFNEDAAECSGEYLTRVSNCHDCYWIVGGCNNIFQSGFNFNQSADNMSTAGWFSSSNSYYSSIGSQSSKIKFSFTTIQCQNCEYCFHCYNCEDCFGCVGLNRKRYCILNKQYEEAAYWRMLDEVKTRMLEAGEYGEFFPAKFSPMRFMDSGAVLMFAAGEQERDQFGALNYPPETAGACGEDRVPASALQSNEQIPDCINDAALDQWVGKPVFDGEAKRRFVLLPQEIQLFKSLGIAPAKQHFVSRVRDLAFRANSGAFVDSICAKCGKSMQVAVNRTYPKRTIYCQSCYLAFMEQRG